MILQIELQQHIDPQESCTKSNHPGCRLVMFVFPGVFQDLPSSIELRILIEKWRSDLPLQSSKQHISTQIYTPNPPQDLYCWWFRNPAPAGMVLKSVVNKEINCLSLNWWVCRISKPSTVFQGFGHSIFTGFQSSSHFVINHVSHKKKKNSFQVKSWLFKDGILISMVLWNNPLIYPLVS